MKKTGFLLTAVLSAGLCFADSAPIALVPYANQRIWQTVFGPSRTLDWRWNDAAVKATLTVNDLVDGKVAAPVEVVRTASAQTGSYTLPTPTPAADSGEGLVEVTLQQIDEDDAVLDTRTARLAFLPAAITVRPAGARFGRMAGRRPVAYEGAWATAAEATTATATFVPTQGASSVQNLPAGSGWFVQEGDTGTLTVSFAGFSGVLAADLVLRSGLILLVQ